MTSLFHRLRHGLVACAVITAPLAFGQVVHAAPAAVDAAPTPAAEAQTIKELFAAIQARDYDRFIGLGNDNFAKLERGQFDAVAQQLGARLQGGYKADRLARYQQQGYEFTLWKVSFKDNGDDIIATMNVTRTGKVGGFVLR